MIHVPGTKAIVETVSYILETGSDGWTYVIAKVVHGRPTCLMSGERKSYRAAARALEKAMSKYTAIKDSTS